MTGISFIIPLYNKEMSVANCLEKIFAQTDDSFEVIVVDDGSTDNSVGNLQQYRDRITLISQQNRGPSAARNAGAEKAGFDCLTFIDADDEVTPDFVRSHLSVREHNPEIELSINSFKVFVDGELKHSENLFKRQDEIHPVDDSCLILDEFTHIYCTNIHSSGYCINKDLFYRVSGFDEELRCWEISDALLKFSLSAKKTAILSEFLSLKYETDNSLFKAENTNLKYRERYCRNILDVMDEIPEHSKSRYFMEIQYLCCEYWRTLHFMDLALLYRKAVSITGADNYFSLPYKVEFTAKLLLLIQQK